MQRRRGKENVGTIWKLNIEEEEINGKKRKGKCGSCMKVEN